MLPGLPLKPMSLPLRRLKGSLPKAVAGRWFLEEKDCLCLFVRHVFGVKGLLI